MLQTTRLVSVLIVSAGLSGTLAFGADPSLLNLVMPDAKVLAGANVTSFRISPLGQFLITKAGALAQGPNIVGLGFNPLTDISEILAASPGNSATPTGIIMATGTFPVDKLSAMAGSNAVQSYGGATLLVTPNGTNNAPHAVAFIGNSIAIGGDLASVKAAIDRRTNPSSIDPALAVKVNQLSGSQDEWLVSTAPLSFLIPANATQQAGATAGPAAQVLPLLKSIQSFDGGVKFGDQIAVNGEAVTTDAKNAAALQAVFKLGLALASSLNTTNNPQFASLVQLLQSIQATVAGAALDLALSVPESQVEALINSLPNSTALAGAAPPARHLDRSGQGPRNR